MLLPASAGGAMANIGVTLGRRTVVNLNFTAGQDGVKFAVRKCGSKRC